jgi:hypothetical protein
MGEERKVYRVLLGKPEGKDRLEDQGIDGRMGSECILGRLLGGVVEWIQLSQGRGQWQAFVNTVTNLRILDSGATELEVNIPAVIIKLMG